MKALRTAALLALGVGAALAGRAADRTGPSPSEVIFPRHAETAPAENTPAAEASPAFAPPPGVSMHGLMPTVGFVVALAVLAGGAWFLIKRGTIPRPFSRNEGRLKVLETRLLGNRQFLVVVEYDDAKMLLGVCQGRIDYLTPLAGHPLATAGTPVGDEVDATSTMAMATSAYADDR
jgi:flagellar biogenesis protein FliO